MCFKLGIKTHTFACYHKNHINKRMDVDVIAFAFEYSIENGGYVMKIGFVLSKDDLPNS